MAAETAAMRCAHEFPRDPGRIYLNHAAVAPWPRRSALAVSAFADENVSAGATHYERWLEVESRLRERLGRLINAAATDIALLKNTSEALSFIAAGLSFSPTENIVIPDEEFPSNRIPWQALALRGEVQLREVALQGHSHPERILMDACNRQTRLLSVSAVQYASGLRLRLEPLGTFCRQRGILFCVDAIQQLGALPLDVQAENIDFVVADGHKWMLGPEGLALFYCRPELREQLRLFEYGWHMVRHVGDYSRRDWTVAADARRFECGSPNLLGAHALEASLGLLQEYGMRRVSENILENTAYLIENIKDMGLDVITPADAEMHAGIVSCRVAEADKVQQALLRDGVNCACRQEALRLSPHFYQSINELDIALAKLRHRVRRGNSLP